MSNNEDIALMAHLTRRAGFGTNRDELEGRARGARDRVQAHRTRGLGGRIAGGRLLHQWDDARRGGTGAASDSQTIALPPLVAATVRGPRPRRLPPDHLRVADPVA